MSQSDFGVKKKESVIINLFDDMPHSWKSDCFCKKEGNTKCIVETEMQCVV